MTTIIIVILVILLIVGIVLFVGDLTQGWFRSRLPGESCQINEDETDNCGMGMFCAQDLENPKANICYIPEADAEAGADGEAEPEPSPSDSTMVASSIYQCHKVYEDPKDPEKSFIGVRKNDDQKLECYSHDGTGCYWTKGLEECEYSLRKTPLENVKPAICQDKDYAISDHWCMILGKRLGVGLQGEGESCNPDKNRCDFTQNLTCNPVLGKCSKKNVVTDRLHHSLIVSQGGKCRSEIISTKDGQPQDGWVCDYLGECKECSQISDCDPVKKLDCIYSADDGKNYCLKSGTLDVKSALESCPVEPEPVKAPEPTDTYLTDPNTGYKKQTNKYLDKTNTKIIRNKTPTECAVECNNKWWCRSFDYQKPNKTCALSAWAIGDKYLDGYGKEKTTQVGTNETYLPKYDYYQRLGTNIPPSRSLSVGRYYPLEGRGLRGRDDKIIENQSLKECSSKCSASDWCKSFDYDERNNKCYLSKLTSEMVKKENPNITYANMWSANPGVFHYW